MCSILKMEIKIKNKINWTNRKTIFEMSYLKQNTLIYTLNVNGLCNLTKK